MARPLKQRVESIRRRAIGLVRVHCFSLLSIAGIFIAVAFGLLDYSLRIQDAAARWILSACALAAVVWAAWRLVGPALRYRPSVVQVAQRIEAIYPQLGQRLSSAIDFLSQPEQDAAAGSTELRRAVVADAEAICAELDFRRAIDIRRPAWALGALVAVIGLVAIIALADLKGYGLAIARLAAPWRSDLAWPRIHQLQFVRRIERIASGDDFEIELVDRAGRLPDHVQIQLRHPTPTGTRTETKEMKPLADRMIYRLDNVTQGFSYRARGGDDDSMPWTELAVIEPPKIVSLAIEVQPPAYTGLPRETAGRVVQAVIGSSLSVRGRVDKPLLSAQLRSQSQGLSLPAASLGPEGLSFAVPAAGEPAWIVEKSAAFWVELADASGLLTGRDTRFEIQATADSPPAIAWESPGDHTFVTPRARVPIKCLVKDNLAVKRIELRYLRPGMSDQGELVVELFSGPAAAKPSGSMAHGDSRSLDLPWDLSRLAGLAPGDVLAVRITAEDYKPQLATSSVRRLTIITDQELDSRVGQRQSSILGQLAEALRIERECRQQLASLQIRLEETGQLDERGLNHLQSAQLNQRQVEKLLGPGPEGAEGQILALLDELAANRVEGRPISERMNELLAHIQQINQQHLGEINQRLTEAYKSLRERAEGAGAGEGALQSLQLAAARQDELIAALEGLLGTLTQWDSFSRLGREIGQIRDEQQRLADATEALRLSVVASEALEAEQRATARQLAEGELDLARRLDKIQGRMEEMLGRLTSSDPLAAGTLADALAAARRLAIGSQMREAAARLRQRQLGSSHQSQIAALAGLAQLLNVLSSQREDELVRNIRALRAAAGELGGLAQRQHSLQDDLDAAAADRDKESAKRRLQRLTPEVMQLADQMRQLGRKLQRLKVPRAADAVEQAAELEAAVEQKAAAGEADSAGQQSRQAQQRLEQAQQELEQAIAQTEQKLVEQELVRMEQWIEGLLARQKNVIAEIERLEAIRTRSQGQLAAAEQETLRNVAAEQRLIADETEQIRLKVLAAAFAFALDGAREEMLRAAALLQRGHTDISAKLAAKNAATRLTQMLSALEPETGVPPDAPPAGQPAAQSGRQGPPGSVAELMLLQLLQGEINRRTQELEAIRSRDGELSDQQGQELLSLAAQQGRLAEMVLNMIRESAERPEDHPDLLPGPEQK
jgi:hypothetical protein